MFRPIPFVRLCCLALAIHSASAFAQGDPLPPIAPAEAGFSPQALDRIDQFFAREVAAGRIPGGVVAIARNGRLVYFRSHGYLDKAAGTPMPRDAIFNLASMTKVMASVAALRLNEEGRLPLKSRLDSYYPEFASMKVGVTGAGGELSLKPVDNPIFIHDLMRHTSGLIYGGRGNHPISKLYPNGYVALDVTGGEFLNTITKLPLAHQPGTAFEYGFSTDVLGLVVEKVAGKQLGDYLNEIVWGPVGMPDTAFSVPDAKRARLAKGLPFDPVSKNPQRILVLEKTPKFHCGGACAFGTVGDYLRFGQMLLDGGAIDGKRVLSPKTVAFMTSNHLGPTIVNNVPLVEPHRDGYSFGLGVAVRMNEGVAAISGTKGDYSWNGANGTAYWADPKEKLVVVMGTVGPGEIRKYFREQLTELVYGAMTKLYD
jgi:CubicO group peptidase (beta-lactamase class C family)